MHRRPMQKAFPVCPALLLHTRSAASLQTVQALAVPACGMRAFKLWVSSCLRRMALPELRQWAWTCEQALARGATLRMLQAGWDVEKWSAGRGGKDGRTAIAGRDSSPVAKEVNPQFFPELPQERGSRTAPWGHWLWDVR